MEMKVYKFPWMSPNMFFSAFFFRWSSSIFSTREFCQVFSGSILLRGRVRIQTQTMVRISVRCMRTRWCFQVCRKKKTHDQILVGGIPTPSDKYESQVGWSFPISGKIKNVPNHQPESDQPYFFRIDCDCKCGSHSRCSIGIQMLQVSGSRNGVFFYCPWVSWRSTGNHGLSSHIAKPVLALRSSVSICLLCFLIPPVNICGSGRFGSCETPNELGSSMMSVWVKLATRRSARKLGDHQTWRTIWIWDAGWNNQWDLWWSMYFDPVSATVEWKWENLPKPIEASLVTSLNSSSEHSSVWF